MDTTSRTTGQRRRPSPRPAGSDTPASVPAGTCRPTWKGPEPQRMGKPGQRPRPGCSAHGEQAGSDRILDELMGVWTGTHPGGFACTLTVSRLRGRRLRLRLRFVAPDGRRTEDEYRLPPEADLDDVLDALRFLWNLVAFDAAIASIPA